MKRYFLDSDDDGHWFVVPVDEFQSWKAWLHSDRDDEESWEHPSFAIPIGSLAPNYSDQPVPSLYAQK